MTNKEWLNSLSESELASFLTTGLFVESTEYEGFPFHINIADLSRRYISSYAGIYNWLSEEQEYEVYRNDK